MAERVINKANNSDKDDAHVDTNDYPLWEQLFELEIQGYFDQQ